MAVPHQVTPLGHDGRPTRPTPPKSSVRHTSGMPRKVLLDVDPGADDAVAIAMAIGSPEIELTGVCTVAGNATIDKTTRNALRVLEFLDRADVPVARGAAGPIVGELTTAEWVHGEGGLRGELPDPATEPIDRHAVTFLLDQVDEHGEALTVACVGPSTNLATALVLDPTITSRVGAVYVMGGAAMTVGNTTPMAEANVHNDPVAAKRVLSAGGVHLVGLDATNHATVPPDLIEAYLSADPPLATVGAWLDYPPRVREFGPGPGPAIHDAAVVAHLVDGVLTFEDYLVDVDTSAGPSRGAIICDRYGVLEGQPNASVAVDIDTASFRRTLRRTLEALADH